MDSRLGHPSSTIVRVLSQNDIPFSSSELNKEGVCDACQMGKSHQLPYPGSNSVSKAPLEKIFSDVWGPACDSINRKNYYVSFIDDYSKLVDGVEKLLCGSGKKTQKKGERKAVPPACVHHDSLARLDKW